MLPLSEDLKVEAMCWLRYGKRMSIVTTEVGRWNADVLGLCDKMAIEVEVKVSKADLLREFANKEPKHAFYAHARDEQDHIPNYFYFIVPESLGEEALTILATKAPKVGVLAFTETHFPAGVNVKILRKPTKLRSGPPSPRLLRTALARMSSELCGSKQTIQAFRSRVMDAFDKMTNGIVLVAAGAVGALDCEEAEIDLDLRAAQLVLCVEGKTWTETEDKDKWRRAAKKWLEIQQYQNREWTIEALRDRNESR